MEKNAYVCHWRLLLPICNYSAPPMGMSNRLTVVLQQELH